MHLGVASGLLKAACRARQIGCTALQIFSDNPTAWRRRPEPPGDAAEFVRFCHEARIAPIAIHASYLINLAGSAEPFASQSLTGLIHELQRAPAYGATIVNTHVGSHRGGGMERGIAQVARNVAAVLANAPPSVRLALENGAGGGDSVGARIEDLARILDAVRGDTGGLGFCLDTAHLWGAGYDVSTADGANGVLERFDELIGLERLAMVHLNDSRSELGSRTDRHEHLGAGRIGPSGLAALLRNATLAQCRVPFVMETPGVEEGYDAVNIRRAWLLHRGAAELPALPARAFRLNRGSTRRGSADAVDR